MRRVAAIVFLVTLVAASCQGFPPVTPCVTVIPSGGCPLDRGGTCDDPACAALYSCVNAVWMHVETCGPHDGGVPVDGSGVPPACATDAGVDAGGCTPVHVDMTGQTTDCTPDLAFPDCPGAAVQGCAECVCLTGCADFYLCKAGGWAVVAHCDDLGALVLSHQ